MRILLCSAQLPGHLDWGGYLPTAVELAQRGHEVIWASGQAVAPLVIKHGLAFCTLNETGWRWPPPPPLPAPADPKQMTEWQRTRALRALDQWLDPARVEPAVDELYAVAAHFKPDLLVSEMFVAAAGIVAEMLDVPFVVAGWPARPVQDRSRDQLVLLARARLETLFQRFQVQGDCWTSSGPPALRSALLHLTFWSERWYAGVPLSDQTRHVGGLIGQTLAADPRLPAPGDNPWVVITLGTSFNDDPNFFVAAAHAAQQVGALPVILLGAPTAGRSWLQQLPATAKVLDHVDFREVLPYSTAAIHHGGAGTTHALVTYAVPQIVSPHAADQIQQAQGIVRSGAGMSLAPREVTVASLATGLAALMPDLSSHRAQAVSLQTEFAALGGAPSAATLLEEICMVN
ncbi:MAG: glycosyltransferase family 1 protein [Anaerolineales bacterium]|nr:glycosyltransferase family 1 protein [Anaerolineales bacterium]